MLRFVVGIGRRGIPGGELERAFLHYEYGLHEFDFVPINEGAYENSSFTALKNRAEIFAERVLQTHPDLAGLYVGAATGRCLVHDGVRTGYVRYDVAALIARGIATKFHILNPNDGRSQLRHGRCEETSSIESIVRLFKIIRDRCPAREERSPSWK